MSRAKWREALLSSEFEQGKWQLRNGDQYCCLGVACEVFRRETGRGEWLSVGSGYDFVVDDDRESFAMPTVVAKWLGYEDRNPQLEGKAASYWNDYEWASFAEIAELI